MNTEEIIRLVFSFLGGGVIVGILDWIRRISSEKETRKIEYLNRQLLNLYGPLYFFTSQNEVLFRLNDKYGEAYKLEYEDVNWSDEKNTQESLKDETKRTIELQNSYIYLVVENNDKILELLKNNYQYINTEDIRIFQEFITDYTRLKNEKAENGKLKTPYRIYKRIGSISFMKPEFINCVSERFNALNHELKKYQAK